MYIIYYLLLVRMATCNGQMLNAVSIYVNIPKYLNDFVSKINHCPLPCILFYGLSSQFATDKFDWCYFGTVMGNSLEVKTLPDTLLFIRLVTNGVFYNAQILP